MRRKIRVLSTLADLDFLNLPLICLRMRGFVMASGWECGPRMLLDHGEISLHKSSSGVIKFQDAPKNQSFIHSSRSRFSETPINLFTNRGFVIGSEWECYWTTEECNQAIWWAQAALGRLNQRFCEGCYKYDTRCYNYYRMLQNVVDESLTLLLWWFRAQCSTISKFRFFWKLKIKTLCLLARRTLSIMVV